MSLQNLGWISPIFHHMTLGYRIPMQVCVHIHRTIVLKMGPNCPIGKSYLTRAQGESHATFGFLNFYAQQRAKNTFKKMQTHDAQVCNTGSPRKILDLLRKKIQTYYPKLWLKVQSTQNHQASLWVLQILTGSLSRTIRRIILRSSNIVMMFPLFQG